MAGRQFDEFMEPGWNEWQHFEIVTIRQAACLLSFVDPMADAGNGFKIVSEAKTKAALISQAVKLGRLRAENLYVQDWNGNGYPLNDISEIGSDVLSDNSEIRTIELAAWCNSKGFAHPWECQGDHGSPDLSRHYPIELRAAIDAFSAVYDDPRAISGKHPRQALAEWLEANRPGLTANARDRIATVANWQPSGGAPKTPG